MAKTVSVHQRAIGSPSFHSVWPMDCDPKGHFRARQVKVAVSPGLASPSTETLEATRSGQHSSRMTRGLDP